MIEFSISGVRNPLSTKTTSEFEIKSILDDFIVDIDNSLQYQSTARMMNLNDI
jgi:hypothetical protein